MLITPAFSRNHKEELDLALVGCAVIDSILDRDRADRSFCRAAVRYVGDRDPASRGGIALALTLHDLSLQCPRIMDRAALLAGGSAHPALHP